MIGYSLVENGKKEVVEKIPTRKTNCLVDLATKVGNTRVVLVMVIRGRMDLVTREFDQSEPKKLVHKDFEL